VRHTNGIVDGNELGLEESMNFRNIEKTGAPQSIMRRSDNEDGVTLLETSIALVIMMIVTLATGSLFAYAINYNSGAGDRAAALAIAQQRMERLRKSSFSDAALTPASATETAINAGRQYSVVTTICSTSGCGGSADLKLLTVQVTPQNANQWANAPVIIVSQRATPSVGPYAGN
jgi:Tfp pilus assembly protein PilV